MFYRRRLKLPVSETVRWYGLVVGLTVVLVLLAALQYRSTKQVSDATTEHMRASLGDSLMDLRQGMERELTPLCYAFQLDAGIPRASASQEYANRLDRWRKSTAHPNLVRDLLVVRSLDGDSPELLSLNEMQHHAVAAEWTKELVPLRAWMRKSTLQSLGLGAIDPEPSRKPTGHRKSRPVAQPPLPWLIDQNIAALVHPEMEIDRDAKGKNVGTLAWIILRLDPVVLGQEVFPDVVGRDFGRESQSSYKIAIVSDGNGGPPLYSSDGNFGRSVDTISDASLNLFGRPDLAAKGRSSADRTPSYASSSRTSAPAAPLPFPQSSFGKDDSTIRIDPIRHSDDDSDWEIIAQHRQGSVEAAVASSYRHSLAINFGVLLVLTVTMALIMSNSRRARKLAQLQVDFVAGVSHELRTPLTGIVAAAQNIADGVIDNQTRMVRYGNAILTQAQQLTDLVEQILLFSATQKGAHRYHLAVNDVAAIVERSLKTTASLTRPAGFSVHCHIQPGLPRVRVDSKALSQCLQNLITNAVKYSGASRWIGIAAVQQNDAVRGTEVAITVEDRGLGMEPEELEHIFEPFYRSPLVTAAQIHGSGLGLPLTKSMVEAMAGRLTVSSQPRKGSRFTIHLPAGWTEPSPSASGTAVSQL